tara:strand:- start:625 stop:1626 length:1002 start_codon:yes stop_codon:yes gene_type:complete
MKLKYKQINSGDISELLLNNFPNLLAGFYEMQSSFLCGLYKRYNSIETANIILCLAKNKHLGIVRKREKNLDHDISFKNLLNNINNTEVEGQKIISIVNTTNVPKETVRRKIKKLINRNFVEINKKTKGYYWNLKPKDKDDYIKVINDEIEILSKFVAIFCNYLNFKLDRAMIANEIKSHFSFYWYHFLTCQLQWLRMWQINIKDIDLILITLQALIPTLQHSNKTEKLKLSGLENLYKIVGKTDGKSKYSDIAISASSVSEITGIPRATCMRKLDTLLKLEVLEKEDKTKRYYINQNLNSKNNIFTKDNVNNTIAIFSEYLSIIINALIRNK